MTRDTKHCRTVEVNSINRPMTIDVRFRDQQRLSGSVAERVTTGSPYSPTIGECRWRRLAFGCDTYS
ncbi:hypothetical protein [Nocardia abscessus]|uniref:hypothetical protein n=1 Tax=Nocardia abscessus TaxID=120957 RepID=UPI00245611E7|nr:hypothetical protein [Nocardia abscessus]